MWRCGQVSAHYPEFRALMFGLAAMRGADEHSARFVPDTPDHRAVANRLVNLCVTGGVHCVEARDRLLLFRAWSDVTVVVMR